MIIQRMNFKYFYLISVIFCNRGILLLIKTITNFSPRCKTSGLHIGLFDLGEENTHFREAATLISMYIIEMSLIAARSLRFLFSSFENRHVNHLIVPKNHMDFRLPYVSRDHRHGTQVIKQGCREEIKGSINMETKVLMNGPLIRSYTP